MKRLFRNRMRLLYSVLIVASLIMAAVGISLTVTLALDAQQIQRSFRDDLHATAAQVDYELLTLLDTLTRFQHPGIPRHEVVERFDILWSRLDTNSTGAAGKTYLALAGAVELIADLRRQLEVIEPQVLDLQRGDAATIDALAAVLRGFLPRSHAVTLRARDQGAVFMSDLYEQQRRVGLWASLFLLGTLVTGIIAASALWLERRRLDLLNRTLEQRVEARTAALRESSEQLRAENAERRHAEAELRHSQARFQDFAEASADWFWETDASLCFTYMSDNMERLSGVTVRSYVGKTWEELLDECDDKEVWAPHIADLKAHRPFRNFEYCRHADTTGDEVWVRINGKPVFAADDTFAGYRGTGSNITAQKRAEEKLRTSEAKLVQAQKMEAIGQLTGGVAHDFNNLLMVILGNTEMLLDGAGDRSQLELIDHAATRAAELTQRLLAFSREQALQPRATDLTALIAALRELLSRTLGEPIDMVTRLADDLWPVLADAGQLENALLNLAINARDAMPLGGTLTIECTNVILPDSNGHLADILTPGGYVAIAVRDTGEGMSQDVVEHAFEPFFTTKDVGQGSGLGLSMVYGFAQQSGGAVVVDSAPGQGSEIRLYLPRTEGTVGAEDTSREVTPADTCGRVVLVVEDEPGVREFAATSLEGLGYKVLQADDATAAMTMLADTDKVDLMLSDVVLAGGIGGPELAAWVEQTYPDTKIVFMTGYAFDRAALDAAPASANTVLRKPFRRAELSNIVHDVLTA